MERKFKERINNIKVTLIFIYYKNKFVSRNNKILIEETLIQS